MAYKRYARKRRQYRRGLRRFARAKAYNYARKTTLRPARRTFGQKARRFGQYATTIGKTISAAGAMGYALSSIAHLRRTTNVEFKRVNTDFSMAPVPAAADNGQALWITLNHTDQGTASSQRIGQSIKCLGLDTRLWFNSTPAAGVPRFRIRAQLVLDRFPGLETAAPPPNCMYLDDGVWYSKRNTYQDQVGTNTAASVLGPSRFVVYREKMFSMTNGAHDSFSTEKFIHWKPKFQIHTRYDSTDTESDDTDDLDNDEGAGAGSTSHDITHNCLYLRLQFFNRTSVTHPITLYGQNRLYYVDN